MFKKRLLSLSAHAGLVLPCGVVAAVCFLIPGCSKPVDEDVPVLIEATTPTGKPTEDQFGKVVAEVSTKSKTGYPPNAGHPDAKIKAMLEEEISRDRAFNHLKAGDKKAKVEAEFEKLKHRRMYGVAFRATFASFPGGTGVKLKDQCPRWVQIARGNRHVFNGGVEEVPKGATFDQFASTRPWTLAGGTQIVDPSFASRTGWFVDKNKLTKRPVYENTEEPGFLQEWGDGTTVMLDVPGQENPWLDFPKRLVVFHLELQSWLVGPRTALRPGTPGQVACIGDDADPPGPSSDPSAPPNGRLPFGMVQWQFTVTIDVGTDADSTSQRISGDFFKWVDNNTLNVGLYRQLMKDNYNTIKTGTEDWRIPE